ncbi:GMP synthase [Pisolithus marmoratus]|nr:GMP synthase [Pisolithus marmoratus]
MAPPHFRLAALECSLPALATLGKYREVFRTWLEASLEIVNASRIAYFVGAEPVTFTLDGYDVVDKMEYPPDDIEYDGVLITGSPFSAYEDLEWINRLIAYVKRIIAEKPDTKLFGICFGHQIIARALGGTCTPNDGKWEVAVTYCSAYTPWQGHPEFTPMIVHAVLDSRAKIFGEAVTRDARTRADGIPGNHVPMEGLVMASASLGKPFGVFWELLNRTQHFNWI